MRDDERSGRSSSTRARCCQGTSKPSSPIKIAQLKQGDSAVYGRAGDPRIKFSPFTTSNKHDQMLFRLPCGTGDVLHVVME
jgi:hypothetical protein